MQDIHVRNWYEVCMCVSSSELMKTCLVWIRCVGSVDQGSRLILSR